MTGQMLAFDKVRKLSFCNLAFAYIGQHMNLVLADTEEFRRVKRKPGKGTQPPGASAPALVESEEKRTLGLAIVRGTHIISCSVDGPPPADPASRLGASAPGGAGAPPTLASGPGISRPAGRGLPVGLTGPAAGVGGPPPPGGFGGFPPGGFPGGAPPPGFPGRGGGPPGGPRKFRDSRRARREMLIRPQAGGFGGPPPGFAPRQQPFPSILPFNVANLLYSARLSTSAWIPRPAWWWPSFPAWVRRRTISRCASTGTA